MKRIRITFAKTELIRFIGHLDVYHIWIRMFRRAKIKLVHSQGFHPQPKIQLASALSLGYTGSHELLECWLEEDISSEELNQRLSVIRHPGIDIVGVEEVPLNLPAMQTRVQTQIYSIHVFNADKEELTTRLEQLSSQPELWVDRKKKTVDVKPFWLGYQWLDISVDNGIAFELVFSAGELTNGKPDEILRLLGLDPLNCLIERTQLTLSQSSG